MRCEVVSEQEAEVGDFPCTRLCELAACDGEVVGYVRLMSTSERRLDRLVAGIKEMVADWEVARPRLAREVEKGCRVLE